jgi:hypothetical protein
MALSQSWRSSTSPITVPSRNSLAQTAEKAAAGQKSSVLRLFFVRHMAVQLLIGIPAFRRYRSEVKTVDFRLLME